MSWRLRMLHSVSQGEIEFWVDLGAFGRFTRQDKPVASLDQLVALYELLQAQMIVVDDVKVRVTPDGRQALNEWIMKVSVTPAGRRALNEWIMP